MTEADPNVDPNVDPDADPDTDPDDGGGDWTPPTKDEHAKMVAALAARKKEAATAKRELAALKAAGTLLKNDPAPEADPDLKTKRQGMLAALTGTGMTKEQAKKAIKLVDFASIDVDEDGDADVDEALNDLRTSFPGLFPRQRAPRVNQADLGGAGGATVDKTSQRLLRQAGYIS